MPKFFVFDTHTFKSSIFKFSVMKTIMIEIDNTTAEEFNKFSPETRTRFGETIAIALKKMINDATKKP